MVKAKDIQMSFIIQGEIWMRDILLVILAVFLIFIVIPLAIFVMS